jgi:hypothetical protein
MPLPDWLSQEDWKAWVTYRLECKQKFTDKAAALSLRELAKLQARGHDPVAVIEQSILNGWKGLFPIRQTAGPPLRVNKQAQLEADNADVICQAEGMILGEAY